MAVLRDRAGRPVVVVTGVGLLTALGHSVAETWAAMMAGRSGIRPITRFDTTGLRTQIAGTIEDFGPKPYSAPELSYALAEAAAREAIAQAGVHGDFGGPVFVATPPSEFEWQHLIGMAAAAPDDDRPVYARMLEAARTGRFADSHPLFQFAMIGDRLKARFGTSGAPRTLCTACASGATTVQMGLEAIRRGQTDRALAIGTDATVHVEGLLRFALLSALSTHNDPPEKASKPFAKNRDGFVIAEGAGALVLERYEAARARGAEVLAVVMGAGEKADHFHRTRSEPSGAAIIGAIRKTLHDARLGPHEIDAVNAHGTSTPENDKMEYLSLRAVMGEHLDRVPVSANKSQIGHGLIAAGSLEAVMCVETLRHQMLPPTLNYDQPDPDLPLDVVPFAARPARVRRILSNSFGFGGQNGCLVLAAEPE